MAEEWYVGDCVVYEHPETDEEVTGGILSFTADEDVVVSVGLTNSVVIEQEDIAERCTLEDVYEGN